MKRVILFFHNYESSLFKGYTKRQEYQYHDTLLIYLQEVLGYLEQINNQIFYLLPINSCDPCVKANLKLLTSIKNHNIFPILIGVAYSVEIQKLIEPIESNFCDLHDFKEEVKYYELGLEKHLVVIYKNRISVFGKQIADYDVDELKSLLEELYINE